MPRFNRKYKLAMTFVSKGVPFAECFLLQALSFSLLPFLGSRPVLVLMPLFYWAMVKTAYLDFIPVMLLGFVQDFMDGTLVGLNVFIFLSLYFVVYYQKTFPLEASFAFSYLAFGTLAFVLLAVKYSIVSLFVPAAGLAGWFMNWLCLAAFFPPLYWLIRVSDADIVDRYAGGGG
jgi:rod shape-determining protein MreD